MQAEGEQEGGAEAAGPHHGGTHDGGKLGVARGAERRGDDHVRCLERLKDDVAPEAVPAEANDFGIARVERKELFSEERNDDGDDKSACAARNEALVQSAVRLVEVMGAYKVSDQDLVPAAEADTQDDGEHGEVRAKDSGGHGDNAQVHHDGGQHHLENLETYGLYGSGKSDADPVRQNHAGTLEVGTADLVVDLDVQDDKQDARGNQPRKHGGKSHALHAHLREPEVSVQKDHVHDGVRNNRNEVPEQVPDGKTVGRDQRREGRLQGAERKADRDDMQEFAGVVGGIAGKPHPAYNLVV